MRELTIKILDEDAAMEAMKQRFTSTMKDGGYTGEFLTFESPTALFRAISPKRWELLVALQKLGVVSMRELARQLKRDVHRVHDDIKSLKDLGVVEQSKDGVQVPFDKIHTDFTLSREAA
jgi:predicted transcriptional regulator